MEKRSADPDWPGKQDASSDFKLAGRIMDHFECFIKTPEWYRDEEDFCEYRKYLLDEYMEYLKERYDDFQKD